MRGRVVVEESMKKESRGRARRVGEGKDREIEEVKRKLPRRM